MKEKQAKRLLKRYRKGLETDLEKYIVDQWAESEQMLGNWAITDEEKIRFGENLKTRIDQVNRPSFQKKIINAKYWIGAAAILIFILYTVIYFSVNRGKPVIAYHNDIGPGGNKAWLTLANGARIDLAKLDSSTSKTIQPGVEIVKTQQGKVRYRILNSKSDNAAAPTFNTIETPRGGQYQIELPDGTRIWLNAASKVKFPTHFSGADQRIVELEGEAYFEVAKDRKHPFLVKTGQQEVQVLGTVFNINAYKENKTIETSLVSGRVAIGKFDSNHSSVYLKPGEKSLLFNHSVAVKAADLEKELAWKNNLFIFKNERLDDIMTEISRWYDVDVVFEKDTSSIRFEGSVSKSKNVSEILRKFELTGNVHFKIEGRRITVMP